MGAGNHNCCSGLLLPRLSRVHHVDNHSHRNIDDMRGGKRAGAGRKPRTTPLTAITVRIEPEVAEEFKTICKDNGRSQPAQITEWVRNACALRALELYKEDRNCEHGGSARSKLEHEFGVEVVREMLSKGIENNF